MEENIITNTEVEETSEVQEAVVEPQTEPEEAVEEKPVQPRRVNQQFKAQRRESERQQLEKLQADNSRLLEALKGYGYSGTSEEVTRQIRAAQAGVSYEEYQKQEERDTARYKEMMRNDPEFLELKAKAEYGEQQAFEALKKDDLAAVKKAYPEVKAKSVEDLGEEFLMLRAKDIPAELAYAAVQQMKEATKKPVPPVMGALNKTPAEKDFYTSAEFDEITRNHPEKLDDPKFMALIRKNMERW